MARLEVAELALAATHEHITILEAELADEKAGCTKGYRVCAESIAELVAERDKLRAFVAEMANEFWGFQDASYEDFQVYAEKYGIIVSIPATPEFKAEWDADEMFVLSWNLTARDEHER